MRGVDRTIEGDWVVFNGHGCTARFHIPDMTVAAAQVASLTALLPLFELVDPPTSVQEGYRGWLDAQDCFHRDYDLPARIDRDGSLTWYRHSAVHRDHLDQPAVMRSGGWCSWFHEGLRHRANGEPAEIWPDGRLFWHVAGEQIGSNLNKNGLPVPGWNSLQ